MLPPFLGLEGPASPPIFLGRVTPVYTKISYCHPYHVITIGTISLELPLFGLFAGEVARLPGALHPSDTCTRLTHPSDTDGSLIVFEVIILRFIFQCYLDPIPRMAQNQFRQEWHPQQTSSTPPESVQMYILSPYVILYMAFFGTLSLVCWVFVAILMCFNLLVEKKNVHCIPTHPHPSPPLYTMRMLCLEPSSGCEVRKKQELL